MIVLSLFDGMSCGQIALGSRVTKYYAAEIDKFAIATTKKNFPNTIHLGNVENWRSWDIDWKSIDILIGGSPCQGFSFIGKNLAFDDPRSKLFFTYVDILKHIQSVKPSVKFFLENVRMKKDYVKIISEALGVEPVVVNSLEVLPQSRERYYWFNWDASVEPEHYEPFLPGQLFVRRHGVWHAREGTTTCIDANYYKGADNHGQRTMKLIDGKYEKLTPEECEYLQGVPIGYTAGVSNTQRYKMLGNGWTIPVIKQLIKE